MKAILSYGFRPFFLLAAIYACVSLMGWVYWLYGADGAKNFITALPYWWHAHEMLFGYTLAVIAGFFLTSVPNWTNSKPVHGPALGLLVSLWIAGRLAIWFSSVLPPMLVMVVDVLFVPSLMALLIRALIKGGGKRNFIFLPILTTLFAANVLTHLEGLGIVADGHSIGQTLALNSIILLVAIIGGRVVPAFTTNALRRRGAEVLPESKTFIEILAVLSLVLIIIIDVIAPETMMAGWIAAMAAIVHTARMRLWQAFKVLNDPMLWIIHLGYLWLVIGLACKAWALLGSGMDTTMALHALTIGSIGSMTLGIMTRAGLGHTGRELVAPPLITFSYALMSIVAVIRVFAPIVAPDYYVEAMMIAGIGWIVVFASFVLVYTPILTKPRLTKRPEAA